MISLLIEVLDLKDASLVGHSTGGGDVARYIGWHGTKRVAKAVLLAVPPIILPIEVFDKLGTDLGLIDCEMCGK